MEKELKAAERALMIAKRNLAIHEAAMKKKRESASWLDEFVPSETEETASFAFGA